MKILDQQRQGECLFIKVDEFDDSGNYKLAQPENGRLIVAHSETGHHHVIDVPRNKNVQLLIDQTNEFMSRLKVKEDTEVKHLRNFYTHDTITLSPGNYQLRYRREYTPEGLRRVID